MASAGPYASLHLAPDRKPCQHHTTQFFYRPDALPAAQPHTHTHTGLTALFPGLPGWAGTRKVTPIWIFLKQETVSGSGISWAVCKSAPRSRQITMPAPHHSVFYRPDALPATQPTASKHWRPFSATNNMQKKFCEDWTNSSKDMLTETYRQARHTLTSPIEGAVKINHSWLDFCLWATQTFEVRSRCMMPRLWTYLRPLATSHARRIRTGHDSSRNLSDISCSRLPPPTNCKHN